MTDILYWLNSRKFLANSLFTTRCLCCKEKELVDGSGVIRTQMGTHNR
jgi:hypothetical protein